MGDTLELKGVERPDPAAVEAIVAGRHGDPFAVLGPHRAPDGATTVRVFWPGAEAVGVLDAQTGKPRAELACLHPAGFFAGPIPARSGSLSYRLRLRSGGTTWE